MNGICTNTAWFDAIDDEDDDNEVGPSWVGWLTKAISQAFSPTELAPTPKQPRPQRPHHSHHQPHHLHLPPYHRNHSRIAVRDVHIWRIISRFLSHHRAQTRRQHISRSFHLPFIFFSHVYIRIWICFFCLGANIYEYDVVIDHWTPPIRSQQASTYKIRPLNYDCLVWSMYNE